MYDIAKEINIANTIEWLIIIHALLKNKEIDNLIFSNKNIPYGNKLKLILENVINKDKIIFNGDIKEITASIILDVEYFSALAEIWSSNFFKAKLNFKIDIDLISLVVIWTIFLIELLKYSIYKNELKTHDLAEIIKKITDIYVSTLKDIFFNKRKLNSITKKYKKFYNFKSKKGLTKICLEKFDTDSFDIVDIEVSEKEIAKIILEYLQIIFNNKLGSLNNKRTNPVNKINSVINKFKKEWKNLSKIVDEMFNNTNNIIQNTYNFLEKANLLDNK